MIPRRTAAQRLDISPEMATRHGLPTQMTEAQVRELEENPPPWLVQSRANRTGRKAVWADLVCAVCGYAEKERPKKWWPAATHLVCDHHTVSELPPPAPGHRRDEVAGVGSRFVALVDVPQSGDAADD